MTCGCRLGAQAAGACAASPPRPPRTGPHTGQQRDQPAPEQRVIVHHQQRDQKMVAVAGLVRHGVVAVWGMSPGRPGA